MLVDAGNQRQPLRNYRVGRFQQLGDDLHGEPRGHPLQRSVEFRRDYGVPTGGLTLASLDGNFYGTTSGTLFRFDPWTNALTVMHTFSKTEGTPQGPPVEAKDKNLYGLDSLGAGPGTAYPAFRAVPSFRHRMGTCTAPPQTAEAAERVRSSA